MDTLIKLTNPEFQIELAGKMYTVRKASLSKVVQYMKRVEELRTSDGTIASGIEILVYAVWLIVSSVDSSITEDFIRENLPGDTDPAQLLIQLGFINPKREAETPAKVPEDLPTSEKSSPSSPSAPDGDPTKSESSPSTS